MTNILLAVSGSIACYKAYDLLRYFKKSPHQYDVKVLLTKGAQKFLRPELFHYLGASACYESEDDFNLKKSNGPASVLHIDLARWCDQFILYPGSANTMAKMAAGQAYDLVSSVFLALEKTKQKFIFPAMNSKMLENPITEDNLLRLKKTNTFIYPPNEGNLLCGEDGKGKIPLPEVIGMFLESYPQTLNKKKVLITSGATKENLDSVRFLTNPSSGLTGTQLAQTFLSAGYEVYFFNCGDLKKDLESFNHLPNFFLTNVRTTKDLLAKVKDSLKENDFNLCICAAAPADLYFPNSMALKLKKSQIGQSLEVAKNPDILEFILSNKKPSMKVIGFAAESSFDEDTIQEKLNRKNTDLLVVNIVDNQNPSIGFGASDGQYLFYQNKLRINLSAQGHLSKNTLSLLLKEWYEGL